MPGLELEYSSVTDRETAVWEKELMGIAFSRKLPDPREYDLEAVYCAEIDAGMDGETVTVIGEVASVTYLTTRKDSRQFVKAMVEDNSGAVEIAVWPRDYEKTTDLWYEGNLLRLELKARLREGEVQLSVETADFLQMKPVLPKPVEISPKEGAPDPVDEIPEEEAVTVGRTVYIEMKQTEDEEGDLVLLNQVRDIVNEYTGEDAVILRVENGTHIDVLRLASTGCCDELRTRLSKVVGVDRVRVETAG